MLNKNHLKKRVKILYTLFFFLLLILPNLSEALELGGAKLVDLPAPSIAFALSHNASFFEDIGGIAFGQVAVGKDNLKIFNLHYNSKRPDGKRLEVVLIDDVGTKEIISADIYDWELIPIANFVNSQYNSLVTFYGHLNDQENEISRRIRGHDIFNYHKAIENTLLGLRLFQGDIMVFMEEATDLPKDDNGNYILGTGENRPNVQQNKLTFYKLQKFLFDKIAEHHRSYVISDINQQITFTKKDGQLVLEGKPLWYCWRYTTKYEEAKDKLDSEFRSKSSKYEKILKNKETITKQTLKDIDNILKDHINQCNQLKGLHPDRIYHMYDYSISLTSKIEILNGINPVVYSALKKTMQFSAFLRNAKENNPVAFQSFLKSLPSKESLPASGKGITPTVMIRNNVTSDNREFYNLAYNELLGLMLRNVEPDNDKHKNFSPLVKIICLTIVIILIIAIFYLWIIDYDRQI